MKLKSIRLGKIYSIIILVLLFSGSFIIAVNLKTTQAITWWDNNWSHRVAISIDHTKVSGTITNFPVLIDITDSNLMTYAQTSGNDIVFTSGDGTSRLNHEIESYSSTSGHLIAWAKVPSLSSTQDTILYLYFGNPASGNQQNPNGVWDSNFAMVQHLEETSGTQYDSTSNGKNAVPNGGVTQGTNGKIDGADSFSGSTSQYLSVGAVSASDWTISFWVNSKSTNYPAIYPIGLGGSTGLGVGGTYSDFSNDFTIFDGSTVLHGGPPVVTNTWYYATDVKSGTTYTIYVDGAPQVSGVRSSISITNMILGKRSDNILPFNGILDEVRISNIPRSADWISTEYNNQNNPTTFATIGSVESSPSGPQVSNPSVANGATGVPVTTSQLSFDLSSDGNLPIDYTVTTSPSIGSSQGSQVSGGRYSVSVSGLSYGTTYTWTVRATEDGIKWTTAAYSFTTELWSRTIISYSPTQTEVTVERGVSQTFQVLFSGSIDVAWYLDGAQMQTNPAVTSSSWENNFNSLGVYTVSAVGTLNGESLTQTWTVQVIINFAGGIQTDNNLYMPPSQSWENGWIFDQTVWQDQGYYYMLYSGGHIGSRQIGFAWSTDGLTWTKDPDNPLLSPVANSWESREVFWASSVIKVSDKTYWAYYQGQDTSGGMHSGVLFLTIDGTTITGKEKYSGNPIVADTYELVVARYNENTWVGYNGYGHSNLLLSSDGLHWSYQQYNVLVPGGYSWDSSSYINSTHS